MVDKYHSDTQEKIEYLSYSPMPTTHIIQTTGDLEAGTKAITATAEAGGIGNADYNGTMALNQPDDVRLEVLRIVARLNVVIDSMTAGTLYCRVYVDQQDGDHLIFDESWSSTGDKLKAEPTLAGTKETIFDKLRDGSSHTYYFFFWVDAGNSVISLVQAWEGVGAEGTGWSKAVLRIVHTGFMQAQWLTVLEGSGSPSTGIGFDEDTHSYYISSDKGQALIRNARMEMRTTVETDLYWLRKIHLILRSEQ